MLFAEDVRGQLKDEFPRELGAMFCNFGVSRPIFCFVLDLKPGELTLLLSDQYRALSEARKQVRF